MFKYIDVLAEILIKHLQYHGNSDCLARAIQAQATRMKVYGFDMLLYMTKMKKTKVNHEMQVS